MRIDDASLTGKGGPLRSGSDESIQLCTNTITITHCFSSVLSERSLHESVNFILCRVTGLLENLYLDLCHNQSGGRDTSDIAPLKHNVEPSNGSQPAPSFG